MNPQLFTAARNGDLDHLRTLTPLEKSLLHFEFSPHQNTPLHVATECRKLDFAEAIVRICEPLLWLRNGAGDTALHVAATGAFAEFVEFFIQFRKLLPMVNLNGDTALHCAARIGSLICVEKIVEADPELCGLVNYNGESPLYLAVAAGYWEVPQVIIDKAKLSASYKGAKGLTALHPTLFYPNYDFEIIKSFVEWRKEMIKEQDDLGLTPLHYASLYGRTKVINLFLQNERSSIYIVDNNNGESALHIAAFKGHKDAVEEILNCCQDSCFLVDNKGRTPLHAAVLGDQRKVVKLILGRAMQGRVMNKADRDGNMALHLAAFHKFYDIIEILATSENVDLNVKNKEFLTALDIFNKHDLEGLRAAVIRNILMGSTGVMTMQHLAAQDIKKMNQEITIIDDDDDDEDDDTNGIISIKKKESSYNTEKQKALEVNLLVATLVATVTFAAGFSMPGGYVENIGLSILSNKGGFKVFVIFNTIAFCCSVFAVLLHFHTSITDHYQRVRYMGIAVMFTSIAIVAMVIAFASGTHVVIANAKAFSLTPFVICGGFAFLYFAIPFCDPGVEGYSFLHIPQRFIRGKIVQHIRYEE